MIELINLNKENYKNYIKTIISIEMDIQNEKILENIVNKYLEDKETKTILNERFEDYLEEILKEN